MTNRKIFAATILAAAGVASGAWAAEPAASKAAPASTSATPSASAPKTCTGVWDFIETDCQLTWYGITGTEPIGWNTSVVFALDAGFDPYSLKLSSGPGSAAHNAGIPQNLQTSWADSSRAGQFYNGNGYVGVSSPSYGTLTVFRQNSLTYDGVLEYDPMGASSAFSPIGWQGITCGGGNSENCRHTTSLKYRLTVGQFRV